MKGRTRASILPFCLGASAPRACAFLQHDIGLLHRSPLSSSPSCRLRLSSFGLTDDGDFLLTGINDGSDGSSDTTAASNFLSTLSLGSADSIDEISFEPAGVIVGGGDKSRPSAQRDVGQFDGLSEDGDFLIVGINGGDPLETTTNEDNYGASSLQSSPSFGLGVAAADDSINMAAVQRFREQSKGSRIGNTGIRSEERSFTGDNAIVSDDDEDAVEAVGVWLSEIIPTLRDSDNVTYSRKLVAIGFDPGCVTQCELTWDDLSFMKLLHRRYFLHEITGQDHPWEA